MIRVWGARCIIIPVLLLLVSHRRFFNFGRLLEKVKDVLHHDLLSALGRLTEAFRGSISYGVNAQDLGYHPFFPVVSMLSAVFFTNLLVMKFVAFHIIGELLVASKFQEGKLLSVPAPFVNIFELNLVDRKGLHMF